MLVMLQTIHTDILDTCHTKLHKVFDKNYVVVGDGYGGIVWPNFVAAVIVTLVVVVFTNLF